MNRTIRVKLRPTPEQAAVLIETTRQFTAIFNTVSAYGYAASERNGVTLHHALYHQLKGAYPALVSDHHIQARVKATEAIRSALALDKKGRKVSAPRSRSCPPRYNVHTFKVDWATRIVVLSTVGGRQRIPFVIPPYAAAMIGGAVATADLIQRDDAWWLHIVINLPAPDQVESNQVVVGVDLGIVQPAVTSHNRFLGKKAWRDTESRYFRLRRKLQASGSKSARRHLRTMRGKQGRFRRDCDHVLSKRLVQSVAPGSTVVVENLTDIRTRIKTRKRQQARRIHGWSFAQLRGFIAYKAEARGVMVCGVDPRNTSRTCPRCGYVAKRNRQARSLFRCVTCGYTLHADLAAARNIAAKYRAGTATGDSGGRPVNPPTVSDAGTRPVAPGTSLPTPVGGG